MTNDAKWTWLCGACQKSYRRLKTIKAFSCPRCHRDCRLINWQTAIPSPKHKRRWRAFARHHLRETSTKEYYAAILDAKFRPHRAA